MHGLFEFQYHRFSFFFLFIAFAEFIYATAAVATIIVVTNFTFQSGIHNSIQTDLTDVDF